MPSPTDAHHTDTVVLSLEASDDNDEDFVQHSRSRRDHHPPKSPTRLAPPAVFVHSSPTLLAPRQLRSSTQKILTTTTTASAMAIAPAPAAPTQRRPVSQQTPGSLTGRPPSGPSTTPFWHAQHAFLARQGEQPTGRQTQTRLAASPRTGVPYLGARSPSMAAPPPLTLETAAHHWERQCRSHPRARPLESSRADPPLLPQHTRPVFHTRGGQQPREGPSKCDGSMAVDQRATSGRASLTIESGHTAPTHGGKEASRPCSPVSAPFWQSHHPIF